MTTPTRRAHLATTLTTTLITAGLLALTGCQPAHATTTPLNAGPIAHSTATSPTAARAILDTLTVRVPDTGAHYRRTDWGDWTRTTGCDTRARVLIRDAVPGSVRRGPRCRVLAGIWVSPYDNTRITDPTGVQIDHRVPVHEANQSGARGWSTAQRARFYNDPTNLVAVSARSNTSKGDGDPGVWRPTNHADWCTYAAGYITTKHTYRLTVDDRERAGLVAMLNTCPGGGGR
jgi:hypothetical protein